MGDQSQKPNKLELNLIENLQPSVFQKVLEFLNKPNLRSCRQVCKIWNEKISTSSIFYSNHIYVINKNVNSTKPLLISTINWPALRFIGCFNLENKMLSIPTNIINKITTLHLNQCIINRKCLNQVFEITTMIDLRLECCRLANSIFKNTVSEIVTLPFLVPSEDESPLNVQCVNINRITISMCDRDISYLVDELFPHLNHLESLVIQELSQYSILQKLKRHQNPIKPDFYGFKNIEFENSTNMDGNDIQLENEFLPFLFEIDSVYDLHQLVNLNQIIPRLVTIPKAIPTTVPENQIQELETLIQEDFLEPMEENEAKYENIENNFYIEHMNQLLLLNNYEGVLEGNEIIGASVIMLQIEEGQNAGVDQAEILEEQLNQIEENQNVGVDQVEILEEQINQLNINPPVILDNAEESMEQDLIPSSDLNPTIQKFLEVIIRNSQTLEEIDFSFRRKFHPWNVQLFTHLIPTILENKLQLKSLILNSFNIPRRNVFFPDGHTQNEFQPLFSTNVVFNLKQFFKSQIGLKKLTLGLNQILPIVQLEILKEIPQTVEILTVWSILPGCITYNNFRNLKEIRIPHDSATLRININAIRNVNNEENVPAFFQDSTTQLLFHNLEELPYLKSFKGEIFQFRNDWNDFTTVATNLNELELKSLHFRDTHMQLIIQNLKKLKRLVLSYVYVTDSGITGFKSQEIELLQKNRNYLNILKNLQMVRTGLPISDLIYLRELKIDRLRLSNFGIYYGLKGLELKMLDLGSRYLRPRAITDWGLNILGLQSNQLEILHLNIGYGVTEHGMKNFMSKLTSLNHRGSKISHLSCTTLIGHFKSDQERHHYFTNNSE